VCDLETSRMGAPYIYDISHLRVKHFRTNAEIRSYEFQLHVTEISMSSMQWPRAVSQNVFVFCILMYAIAYVH
jgi:hypothetical protein